MALAGTDFRFSGASQLLACVKDMSRRLNIIHFNATRAACVLLAAF